MTIGGQQGLSCQIGSVQIKDPQLLFHAPCDNAAAIARKVASTDDMLMRKRVQNITRVCVPDLATIKGSHDVE